MYLISAYFDESADKTIKSFMKQIARHTGNNAMPEGKIPPHITIAAFEAHSDEEAKELFRSMSKNVSEGEVYFASVGAFFPRVLYLAPVLNEYLHQLSLVTSEKISEAKLCPRGFYEPFAWMPHVTLGKTLSGEQLKIAFEVMQSQFAPMEARITKIGVAKTKPYTDLEICILQKKK